MAMFDDILGPSQAQPLPGPAPASGMLDDILGPIGSAPAGPADRGSMAGNFMRQMGQSATYNFGDEAVGALGGEDAKKSYNHKLDSFYKDHPWLSNTAAFAGTVGSLLTPVGWLGRLGKAGQYAGKLLPNANAAASIPGAAIPRTGLTSFIGRRVPGGAPLVGSHAGQAGITGLKMGMLNRAGAHEPTEDENTLESGVNRVIKANDLTAMPLDYGMGAAGGWAGNKLSAAISQTVPAVMNSIRGGTKASRGDTAAVQTAIDDGLTDMSSIRELVMPAMRGRTPQEVENVLEQYGQRMSAGMDDLPARREIAAGLVQGGMGQRTAENMVRTITNRYSERNAIPSQMHELIAQATDGEANNSFQFYRGAVNKPGAIAAQAQNFARGRQQDMADTLTPVLQRHLGDGNIETAIAEHQARAGAANDLYPDIVDPFDANPAMRQQLSRNIKGVFEKYDRTFGHSQDDVASGVRAHLNKFRNRVPVEGEGRVVPKLGADGKPLMARGPDLPDGTPQYTNIEKHIPGGTTMSEPPMDSLAAAIRQRGSLRDAKEGAFKGSQGTLGVELGKLYDDISEAMSSASPAWKEANDVRFGAFALRKSYDEGLSIPMKAGTGQSSLRMKQAIGKFEKMTPERQDMFRRGLMANIRARLESSGGGHDLAKVFNNRQARELLTRTVGERDAETIYTHLRRVGLATRTNNANKGSPTGSIAGQTSEEEKASKLMALTSMMMSPITAPLKMAGAGINYAAGQIGKTRRDDAMRLLSANTENPAEMIRALRQMEAAMRNVNAIPFEMPAATGSVAAGAGIAGGKALADEGRYVHENEF